MSTFNKVKDVAGKVTAQSERDPHTTDAASQGAVEPKSTTFKPGPPVYTGHHPDVQTSAPLGSNTGTAGTHTGSAPTHAVGSDMATVNSNPGRDLGSQQEGTSKSVASLHRSLSHPQTGSITNEAATSLVPPSGPNSHATGPAPNTAGPHKSNRMNALDPRVDSDLDGSRTYGGNKTLEG